MSCFSKLTLHRRTRVACIALMGMLIGGPLLYAASWNYKITFNIKNVASTSVLVTLHDATQRGTGDHSVTLKPGELKSITFPSVSKITSCFSKRLPDPNNKRPSDHVSVWPTNQRTIAHGRWYYNIQIKNGSGDKATLNFLAGPLPSP